MFGGQGKQARKSIGDRNRVRRNYQSVRRRYAMEEATSHRTIG